MLEPNKPPKEYCDTLVLPLKLIRNCGFTKTKRSFAVIFQFTSFVLFYISTIAYGSTMFQKESVNLNEVADVVSVFLVNTQIVTKFIIIISKQKEIATLIDDLGKLWRVSNLSQNQSDKKDNHIKRLQKFNKSFYIVSNFGSWNYMLLPLLLSVVGVFTKKEWEFAFPFSCTLPFDPTSSWITYVLAYVFQVYSMFWTIEGYNGSIILTVTLCAQISIEFEHLQDDVLNIINTKELGEINFDADMRLAMFVKRHQALILIAEQYNKIFNKIIFLDLFFVHLTICFFGFSGRVTTELQGKITNFIGVIALILPTYSMCYYGEMLYSASSAISDSVYHTTWYSKTKTVQRILLLILMRSQLPCTMTSLYTSVTLNTFAKVLRATWSYFSLINSVYEDSNQ